MSDAKVMSEQMFCAKQKIYSSLPQRNVGIEIDDEKKVWTLYKKKKKATSSSATPSPIISNSTAEKTPRMSHKRMKDCKTLEEAMEAIVAMSKERLETRDLVAFWAVAPRLLIEFAHSPAREHYSASKELEAIWNVTLQSIESLNPQELATMTLGLGKIMNMARADDRGGSFPEELGGLLSGPDHVLDRIATRAMTIMPEFDPRTVANLAYAYAVAGYSPKTNDKRALFDHLAGQNNSLLRAFTPQGLTNILWAYSTLGTSNSSLFQEAGNVVVSLEELDIFNQQHLSNILWSYETAKELHPKLFQKVADHIVSLDHLNNFTPRTCSTILSAFATANDSQPKLFEKIACHILSRDNLSEFREQDLCDISWAYATAGQSNPRLFLKIAKAAVARQNEFSPEGIVHILWAHASMGEVDNDIFSSFLPSVTNILQHCSSKQLANISWAYAVSNVAAPSVFNASFTNACHEKENEYADENLRQLHQWQLWQEELQSDIGLPPSLQKKCYEAFISRRSEPSMMQKEVLAEMLSMGLQSKTQTLVKCGYRLDAVVDVNGKKIGIEVDDLSRFAGRKFAGGTVLKQRQVTNLEGIRVASVPYWEWQELGSHHRKKQAYLQLLLGIF